MFGDELILEGTKLKVKRSKVTSKRLELLFVRFSTFFHTMMKSSFHFPACFTYTDKILKEVFFPFFKYFLIRIT